MNPFLHDPIAQPLATRSSHGWRRAFPKYRSRKLALAAGLSVAFAAQATDVNTASTTELQALRGLGPRTAEIIVQERDRAGRFESLQDLSDRVKGLGHKRLQSLQAAGLVVGAVDQAALNTHIGNTRPGKSADRLSQVRAVPIIETLP